MGANQSNGGDLSGWDNSQTTNKGHHSSGNRNKNLDKNKKNKAKPSPPIKVRSTDLTHNSISLSWMPPRHVDGHSVIAYTVEICSPSSSGGDKLWKMLTKSCQGTNYEARHLEPNTDYAFRVRAENIYGTGKPSAPSEVITTKMFDTLDSNDRMLGVPSTAHSSPEKSFTTGSRKRQSFNMHLDGHVSTILSHSDIVLSPSCNANFSYSTTTLNSENSPDSEDKSQKLTRNNINRTSWQSGSSRKVSLPILLPGTATNSLNRLRESRNSLRTSTSDIQVGTTTRDSTRNKLRDSRSSLGSSNSDMTVSTNSVSDSKKKSDGSRSSLQSSQSDITLSNSRDGCSNDGSKLSLCDSTNGNENTDNNDGTTTDANGDKNNKDTDETNNNNNKSDNMNEVEKKESNDDDDDDVYKLKEQLKNLDLPEDKLKFSEQKEKRNNIHDAIFSKTDSQKGYYESLDNPWEKDTSVDGVSERIMAAPFCDDIKMALYAKNLPEDHRVYVGSGCPSTNPSQDQAGDFRTLRSVLQGNNMIVKTSRSLPDVVGLVMGEGGEARTLTRGTLTTIMDVDEDDDPVRVTTL